MDAARGKVKVEKRGSYWVCLHEGKVLEHSYNKSKEIVEGFAKCLRRTIRSAATADKAT